MFVCLNRFISFHFSTECPRPWPARTIIITINANASTPAMTLSNKEKTMRMAKHAIRMAMKFSLEISMKNKSVSKEDFSPVSLADLGCQLIVKSLLRDCPPHSWIAEEDLDSFTLLKQSTPPHIWGTFMSLLSLHGNISGEQEASALLAPSPSSPASSMSWILDPIDGTLGYLRGDQYSICLSLLDHATGSILLGIIGCPRLPFQPRFPSSLFYTSINSSTVIQEVIKLPYLLIFLSVYIAHAIGCLG